MLSEAKIPENVQPFVKKFFEATAKFQVCYLQALRSGCSPQHASSIWLVSCVCILLLATQELVSLNMPFWRSVNASKFEVWCSLTALVSSLAWSQWRASLWSSTSRWTPTRQQWNGGSWKLSTPSSKLYTPLLEVLWKRTPPKPDQNGFWIGLANLF